ncbi:sodium:solute symporter family protein [Paraliobacillus salinarum]|uniref:sodium:solute symporter family protein n=1 Tax=Paraliobacillus salinarum TaxID=1158996 RepID=UPI0015F5BB5C|nr:sodium:solute symporter family protein [Paraliobacillus salinarum]
MTEYGVWMIGFALIYTLLLIVTGNIARVKASNGNNFFVGGRNFRWWTVAFCITGLFSGSTYISIVELSYLTGVSAIWYGIAETVQVLIIALLMIKSFRKRMMITISGLIGDQFGRTAKAIAGLITAFAFPMWSVATAIAFASALNVFTGISLSFSVAFTAILLFVYLQAGGMWSVAFTQTMNSIVFLIMLIVGLIAFFINPGVEGLKQLALTSPAMFDFNAVGTQVIVAWFGTFIVNVILAQAAFQMALSCRTPEEGQKGLIGAVFLGIPFILCGILFGLAAAVVVPGESLGLVALPNYLMEVLPAPLVGLFFLGIWACALSWGAPCQFSGATSLGKDVGSAIFPKASNEQLVRYTKISLLLLTGLMIVFGLLRTEQSAWWNVLAWTTRNAATFAPVVAALFWPVVTKHAVVSSLLTGFFTGLVWYHLGGWQPTIFYLDIHPVWVGMSTNVLTIILVTLVTNYRHIHVSIKNHAIKDYFVVFSSLVLATCTILFFKDLHAVGLLGLFGFSTIVTFFLSAILFVREKVEQRDQTSSLTASAEQF